MPTTVRVEDAVKRDLDRLQGDFLSERGERLSHSELLARLLRFARLHEDEILREDGDADRPRPEDVERWRAALSDVRVRARARDVDRALYGSRP